MSIDLLILLSTSGSWLESVPHPARIDIERVLRPPVTGRHEARRQRSEDAACIGVIGKVVIARRVADPVGVAEPNALWVMQATSPGRNIGRMSLPKLVVIGITEPIRDMHFWLHTV
ncbi:hypothetical protein ACVIGA_002427 [Bradyrhizobium sp. USDA 3240]